MASISLSEVTVVRTRSARGSDDIVESSVLTSSRRSARPAEIVGRTSACLRLAAQAVP